jgi:hypothetical protein
MAKLPSSSSSQPLSLGEIEALRRDMLRVTIAVSASAAALSPDGEPLRVITSVEPPDNLPPTIVVEVRKPPA